MSTSAAAAGRPQARVSADEHGTEACILVVRKLSKHFGGLKAVDDVDLSVRRGSIHALIGPNGAGKTTCFNLLTKFLVPTSGTIVYDGQDITNRSAESVARMGIVRSFQISATFPNMTALENVRVFLQRRLHGDSFDFWRSDRILDALNPEAMELLAAVGLEEHAGTFARELPYGGKRALEIATSLALDPHLLLLDEPMAGISHDEIPRISELIRTVASGRTVLMVEHNLPVVSSLADTVTVLARGRVLAEGTYAEVSSAPAVMEAYIGAPA